MNDLAKASNPLGTGLANLQPLQIFIGFPRHSSGSSSPLLRPSRPGASRLAQPYKAQPAHLFFANPENFSPHVETRQWR